MANLIFPTGTSDDDGGMLLEVYLAGSTQFLPRTYCSISTGYIFVDKMYARYVAMRVTHGFLYVYSLHFLKMNACMNEYSWLIHAFVQLPTFHFMFKGNHLLR